MLSLKTKIQLKSFYLIKKEIKKNNFVVVSKINTKTKKRIEELTISFSDFDIVFSNCSEAVILYSWTSYLPFQQITLLDFTNKYYQYMVDSCQN